MDTEKYKALLTAIDEGSLSAAAEKLGYTPSGISRMIAALEQQNGFALLKRGHGGVFPTEECVLMLPTIRQLIAAGENCRQLSAQIRGTDIGTVTVGTAYNAYYMWLAKVIADFQKLYPGISVQIKNGYSSQLLDMLHQKQLDICFISQREGEHGWMPICRDPMMALLSENHPMTKLTEFPIEYFESEPYITTYPGMDVDSARVFAKCGIRPNTQITTTDSIATCSMVEAGLGVTMNNRINAISWKGRIKALPLFPPQTVEIGIAHDNEPAPAAKKFLEFIVPHLDEITNE